MSCKNVGCFCLVLWPFNEDAFFNYIKTATYLNVNMST